MAHDVFISYATEDREVADQLCAMLERNKVRCWIAPRDVLPTTSYAAAIVQAIRQSRLLILVFSSHTNRSSHVRREIEQAGDRDLPILLMRLEADSLSDTLEYYIGKRQWFDALTDPRERHLERLTEAVQILLRQVGRPEPANLDLDARDAPPAITACAARWRDWLGEATSSFLVAEPSPRGATGYYQRFQHGTILWSRRGGAQPMWWAINDYFHQRGGSSSRLGFPLTDEIRAMPSPQGTRGVFQRFEGSWDYQRPVYPNIRCGATVYWSEQHGAHAVWGGIGEYYDSGPGTEGLLGFPTSDETEAAPSPRGTTGWYQRFEGGVLFWCERAETQLVCGPISGLYDQLGGTAGILGFPLTGAITAARSPQGTSGGFQRFEDRWDYPDDLVERFEGLRCGASIYWSEPHGAQPVRGGIGIRYERLWGTASFLGFPTSPELETPASPQGTTGVVQRFEGGAIYWCWTYDAIPVSGPVLALYEQLGTTGSSLGFPTHEESDVAGADGQRSQRFEGGTIVVIDGHASLAS